VNKPSPETILALLTEIARRLNQNLAKVNITPLEPAFSTGEDSRTNDTAKQTSNL